jgi:hypothetical protein
VRRVLDDPPGQLHLRRGARAAQAQQAERRVLGDPVRVRRLVRLCPGRAGKCQKTDVKYLVPTHGICMALLKVRRIGFTVGKDIKGA